MKLFRELGYQVIRIWRLGNREIRDKIRKSQFPNRLISKSRSPDFLIPLFSDKKGRINFTKVIFIGIFAVLFLSAALRIGFKAVQSAGDASFNQTNWSVGQNDGPATQTGWDKYSSTPLTTDGNPGKDLKINVSTVGEIKLGVGDSKIDDTDNDFNESSNLAGEWSLDEYRGITVNDGSGNNNVGGYIGVNDSSLTNSPTWVAGKYGTSALNFDGVDDYISVSDSDSLDITNNLSISAWINASALPTYGHILAKRVGGIANYGLRLGNAGVSESDELQFYYWDGTAWQSYQTSNANLTIGVWYHIAITYTFGTGSSIKIYKDGALLTGSWNMGAGNTAVAANGYPLTIGSNGDPGEYFKGVIDEVRIYNKVLDPVTEIPLLSSPVTKNNVYDGLTGYWNLDENTGTIAKDTHHLVGSNNSKFGNALNFNGAGDYVYVSDSNSLDITNTITMSAWINPSALPAYGHILAKRVGGIANYGLRLGDAGAGASNQLQFYYWDGTAWQLYQTSNANLATNTWYHIAMTYTFGTGSSIKIYKDGALVTGSWTMGAGNTAVAANGYPLTIGSTIGSNGNPGEYFKGIIDEMRIYNTALSEPQIKVLYNANAKGKGNTAVSAGNVKLISNYDIGNGADGAIIIASAKNINTDIIATGRIAADGVNWQITNTIASGATTISSVTARPSGFDIGDEVLIINLKGTSADYSNTGCYEFRRITALPDANSITVSSALKFAYNGTTQKIMVQRVPNYTNVTINTGGSLVPAAWDGSKGGVLVFRANGTVTVNTANGINADSKGFLGGVGVAPTANSNGGESYNGAGGNGGLRGSAGSSGQGGGGGGGGFTSPTGGGAGTIGSGGGGGGITNIGFAAGPSGAGGGGGNGLPGQPGAGMTNGGAGSSQNGGTGGAGGWTGFETPGGGGGGGETESPGFYGRVYLGGGGGAGGGFKFDVCNAAGVSGGNGGGVVFISALNVNISSASSITVKGANGVTPSSCNLGGGGGGGGGSLIIFAKQNLSNSGIISAGGGSGSWYSTYYAGGNGGGGRIFMRYSSFTGSSPATTYHSENLPYYYTSGYYTSQVLDTNAYPDWGIISWAATLGTGTLAVYVRAADNPDMSAATAWVQQTNGLVITGIVDGYRYIQYRVDFAGDGTDTPVLNTVTINYTAYPRTPQEIISSYFNSTVSNNIISKIHWTELIPGIEDVQIQLQTAPDNLGSPGAWSNWLGPTSGSDYYSAPLGTEFINPIHRDGTNDQWFRYKVRLSTNGVSTPVLSDFNIDYDIAVPAFTAGLAASNPAFSPNADTVKDTTDLTFTSNETGTYNLTINEVGGTGKTRTFSGSMTANVQALNTWNGKDNSSADFVEGTHTASVTITDGAGRQTLSSTINIILDKTAPTGGSITYTNGKTTVLSTNITFVDGSDALSGISSKVLQRAEATFTNDIEGSYSSFSQIGLTNPVSPYTDNTLQVAKAYKYRYVVTDVAGNSATYTSASVVKVTGTLVPGISGPIVTAGVVSGAFTLTAQDSSGNTAGSATLFNLSSGSIGTKTFYSDAGGTIVITSVTINAGTASTTFYYKDTKAANPVITATWVSGHPVSSPTTTASVTVNPNTAVKFTITGNSSQVAGVAQQLTISAYDASDNLVSGGPNNYTGDKSLTFSGANTVSSGGATYNPTVTDKIGANVNFGTATTVTFTNGISSAGGSMKLYKAEIAPISATATGVTTPTPLSVTVASALTISSPNGIEQWKAGKAYNISWTTDVGAGIANVKLSYSIDGGTSYTDIITDSVVNTSPYSWTVPDYLSGTVKVKIENTVNPAVLDESNSNFSIVKPAFTLLTPSGAGITLGNTQSYPITWSSEGTISNNLSLYYANEGGLVYPGIANIASAVANSGTYTWTVPDDPRLATKVKIEDVFYQQLKDTNDTQFNAGTLSQAQVSGTGNGAGVKLGQGIIFTDWSQRLSGTYDTTGTARGVYVSGNYAYVADDTSGLQIINITNPAAPVLAGTYDTTGNALDVYVSGNYAYVADNFSGLQIINITNPAAPVLAGTYDTTGNAQDVYVSGNYAYVADYTSGLQIINITNPAAPVLAGTYGPTGGAYGVYVSGNYAYVADNLSGLQIINITNPAAPVLAGTYDTTGNAQDVYVSGNYAYVADYTSGLQIINITNPAAPVLAGTYGPTGGAYGVYVSGNYAYVADNLSGLQIINITNPAAPVLAGTYDTTGNAYGVYVSGNYAYVADNLSGLQIINITNPAAPVSAGTYDTTGNALDVYVSVNYVYVADNLSGLQIINITNPAAPVLAGTYNTPYIAYGVYVSGNYAYVADNLSGLQIINITNPAAPVLAGTYDTTGTAYGVYVSGNYAYVADDLSGLQIINITNPAAPALAGTYDTTGNARGVYVSGNYAYVADYFSGLQIINITNPAAPVLAGTYDTTGTAYSVYVSGNYAYVADDLSGLQIINITNPAVPALAGTYDTTGNAYGVYVSGNYAYVADSNSGLQIINITNPAAPVLAGTYDTPYIAYGVYVSGNYAYVADNLSGLQIINITNPAAPALAGTYDTTGNAYGVYVSGNYAYVADSTSGLQIINVISFSSPGTFTSRILDTAGVQNYNKLEWTADVPAQCGAGALKFQLAGSACSNGATNYPTCTTGTWTYYGPTSTADYYTTSATQINSIHNGQQYIRYKAYLSTLDVNFTPTLNEVKISFLDNTSTDRVISDESDNNLIMAGKTAAYYLSAPADIIAGNTAQYTLTRKDSQGTLVTVGAETVTLSSGSTGANKQFRLTAGGAALSPSQIIIPDGSSSVNFYYYDELMGSHTITASRTGVTSGTDIVNVLHAADDHLKFQNNVATASQQTVAFPFPLGTIEAVDRYGNILDNSFGAIAYSGSKKVKFVLKLSSDGVTDAPKNAPNASATDSFQTASTVTFTNGVSTTPVSATLYRAQTAKILAREVDIGGMPVLPELAFNSSNDVAVIEGDATYLEFAQQPSATSPINTALAQQPRLKVLDTYGNQKTTAVNAITLYDSTSAVTYTKGPGTLTVTANPLSATGGLAQFSGVKYSGDPLSTSTTIYLYATTAGLSPAFSSSIVFSTSATSSVAASASPIVNFSLDPVKDISDTPNNKFSVLRFKVTDDGSDGIPTLIDRIRISIAGTGLNAGTDTGWAGLHIYSAGTDSLLAQSTAIDNNYITFGVVPDGNSSAGLYSLADNSSVELTVYIAMKNSKLTAVEGQTYTFNIDKSEVYADTAYSSRMAAASGALYASAVTGTISVATTNLEIVTEAGAASANLDAGTSANIKLRAVDKNKNIDINYVNPHTFQFSGLNPINAFNPTTVGNNSATFGNNCQITFTSGVSNSAGLTAYKKESGTVTAIEVGQSYVCFGLAVNVAAKPADIISLISGNSQSSAINTALGQPLKVAVSDTYGNRITGHSVTFNIDTVPVGATGTAINPLAGTTDVNGEISTALTLGNLAGTYKVKASALKADLITPLLNSPLTFTENGVEPSAMNIYSGNDPANKAVTDVLSPFVVELTGLGGIKVPNAAVQWTIINPLNAGESLSAATATTDANGLASTVLTLGNKTGIYSVKASYLTFQQTFTATANPMAPNKVVLSGPAGITAGVAASFTLKIQDQYSNDNLSSQITSTVFSLTTTGTGAFYLNSTDAANSTNPVTSVTLTNISSAVIYYKDNTVIDVVTLTATRASGVALLGAASASISVNFVAADLAYFKVTAVDTSVITAGTGRAIKVTGYDNLGNVKKKIDGVNTTADLNITFSGASVSNSPSSKAPTCSDKNSLDVNFASAVTLTFVNGIANTTMKLYKVETAHVKAANGAILTSDTNDLDIDVKHTSADHVKLSAAIPIPGGGFKAGTAFTLSALNALDVYDNLCDITNGGIAYTGIQTVNYTLSTGLNNAPDGTVNDIWTTSVNFSAGISTTALDTTLYRAQTTAITPKIETLTGTNIASESIVVQPGAIAKLFYSQQPSTGSLTNVILTVQPKVAVADQYGNAVSSTSDNISLAASTTSGTFTAATNGTLTGDALTVATVSGTAIFSGLKYSYPETIYLRATSAANASLVVYSSPIAFSTSATGKLEAGILVEPATISSLADSAITKVQVFDFKVTDMGGDSYDTKVKQIVIAQKIPTDTTGGWLNYISGATLSDGALMTTGAISDNTVSFGSGVSTIYTIGEGLNKTFTLSIYLKSALPAGADNKVIAFSAGLGNITVDSIGSKLDPATIALTTSPAVDVAATKFIVGGSSSVNAGIDSAITIKAADINANIDLDYTADKNIIFSGASASLTGNNPTCTNYVGTPVVFGQVTPVSFSLGQSSSTITMKLYKAEAAHIKATIGAITTSDTDDLDIAVSGGTASKLSWDTQPEAKVAANAPWKTFKVAVSDAYGNNASSNIGITVTPTGATAGASATTTVTAQSGIATFSNFSVYSTVYPSTVTLNATAAGVTASGSSSAVTLSEKYYITAKALDSVNGSALTDLTFKILDAASGALISEPTFLPNPKTGNSPFSFYLPYGKYNFNFTKDAYVETTTEKIPDVSADGVDGLYNNEITWTIFIMSIAESLADYRVLSDFVYDETTDKISAVVRLEKRGKQIVNDSVNTLQTCTLKVFPEGPATDATMLYNSSLAGADINGNYWFYVTGATASKGFAAGKRYFVKIALNYGGASQVITYTAVNTFDISVTARLKAWTEEVKSEVSGVKSSVAAESATTRQVVSSEAAATKAKVISEAETTRTQITVVQNNTAKVLTATETTLPSKITAAREEITSAINTEIKPSIKSGILNRENVVKSGDTIVIRYRTATGKSPKVDVYDPKNILLLSKGTMRESGTTGVYEYSVRFSSNWGLGEFTVVCSESSLGTVDALVISVVAHDIEDISGQTSAILGSTSGISGLSDVADELNTQFGALEEQLNSIGEKIAGKVEETKGAVSELESIFKQLTALSKQVKSLGGTDDINLEKLYEVSVDKKEDINYLKNKTQELKAAMELNKKLMENVAKKPVVQTWFEYR